MAAKDPPAPVNDAAGTAATAQWSDETPFRRILRRSAGFLILFWLLVAFYFSPGWRFSPLSAWPDSDATGALDFVATKFMHAVYRMHISRHRPDVWAIGLVWFAAVLLFVTALWLIRNREDHPAQPASAAYLRTALSSTAWTALCAPIFLGAIHAAIGMGSNHFRLLHPDSYSILMDPPQPPGQILARFAFGAVALMTGWWWSKGRSLYLGGRWPLKHAQTVLSIATAFLWFAIIAIPHGVPGNRHVRYIPLQGWRTTWEESDGTRIVISHVPWRKGWASEPMPTAFGRALQGARRVGRIQPSGCVDFLEIRYVHDYEICYFEGVRAPREGAGESWGRWTRDLPIPGVQFFDAAVAPSPEWSPERTSPPTAWRTGLTFGPSPLYES